MIHLTVNQCGCNLRNGNPNVDGQPYTQYACKLSSFHSLLFIWRFGLIYLTYQNIHVPQVPNATSWEGCNVFGPFICRRNSTETTEQNFIKLGSNKLCIFTREKMGGGGGYDDTIAQMLVRFTREIQFWNYMYYFPIKSILIYYSTSLQKHNF